MLTKDWKSCFFCRTRTIYWLSSKYTLHILEDEYFADLLSRNYQCSNHSPHCYKPMLEDNLNFHLLHKGIKMCVLIKLHII